MRRRCVLLFARSPELEGRAKGLEEARDLFALARHRVVSAAARVPGVTLVVAGGGAAPAGARRLAQRGRSFGERLDNAFRDAAALGFTEIVVVPSDVPALAAPVLALAFRALDAGAAALGPSPDGGVYLIGLRAQDAALLRTVRWRTPRVLSELLARAADAGLAPALLPPLRDVDTRRDLEALRRERPDAALAVVLDRILARVAPRPAPARAPSAAPAARDARSRAPPAALAA